MVYGLDCAIMQGTGTTGTGTDTMIDLGRKPIDERAHNLIMNEFYKNADYAVNALVTLADTPARTV